MLMELNRRDKEYKKGAEEKVKEDININGVLRLLSKQTS